MGKRVAVANPQSLDTQNFTASVIIGIDNPNWPLFLDIRYASNDADDFATFVTLTVTMEYLKRGDILVYDNAAVHFGGDTFEELETLFEENGITILRLPTYSPELNPIERCFNLVKSHLRYQRGDGHIEEITLTGRVGIQRINEAKLVCKRSSVANSYPYPACVISSFWTKLLLVLL